MLKKYKKYDYQSLLIPNGLYIDNFENAKALKSSNKFAKAAR